MLGAILKRVGDPIGLLNSLDSRPAARESMEKWGSYGDFEVWGQEEGWGHRMGTRGAAVMRCGGPIGILYSLNSRPTARESMEKWRSYGDFEVLGQEDEWKDRTRTHGPDIMCFGDPVVVLYSLDSCSTASKSMGKWGRYSVFEA